MARITFAQSTKQPRTILSVCVLLAVLLTAGCSGEASEAEGGREGTLRAMNAALPQSLDPVQGTNPGTDYPYLTPVYDRLLQVDVDMKVQPMLAESWTVEKTAITFKLRSGVEFHDGTPFDASAVVANIERIKATPESLAAGFLAGVTSVTEVDPQTVKVNVKPGEGEQLVASFAAYPQLGMASPKAFETLATTPVGTGLYRVSDIRQDRISYERVDGYWDADLDASAAEKLEIVGSPEEVPRLNALRTGQTDVTMFSSITDEQLDALPDDYQQTLVRGVHRLALLLVNANDPALAKPEVRKAMSLAIDREGIASLAPTDMCVPQTQLSAEGTVGHVEEPESTYDIEQAKALMAEAGVGNLRMRLLTPDLPQRRQAATAVQAQLKEIGIDAEIVTVSAAVVVTEWQTGNYQLGVFGSNGGIDPSAPLEQRFGNSALDALDPAIARMAAAARTLPVGSEDRDQAYQELNQYLIEKPFHIIICAENAYLVARPNVVNFDQQTSMRWQLTFDSRNLALETTP